MRNYRKINIVIMDDFYNIIDRFNLDAIVGLSGLGFKFNIYTIKSGVMEYLTNIIPENISIKINILFLDPNAYDKYNSFKAFITKYSALNNKMLLEYNDTTTTLYADIRIEQCDKGEKTGTYLAIPTIIKRLSTYYTWEDRTVISYNIPGKTYPFTYPFTYGAGLIQNNEIKNRFIFSTALVLVITGVTPSPYITLSEPSEENYQIIKFKPGADLAEGDRLIIDSLTSQILYYPAGSLEPQDWFDNVDMDATSGEETKLVTHMFAKPNKISKLALPSLQAGQSGKLECKYRMQVL